MAAILYGVCGEGIGHATRAWAVINRFQGRHDFHVATYGQAFDFFRAAGFPMRRLIRVGGLRFSMAGGRVKVWRTLIGALRFVSSLPQGVGRLARRFRRRRPDLVITDFEPTVPRVAFKLGVPCLSLDNQHKFLTSDMSELPTGLRTYSAMAGEFVRHYIPEPDRVVVANFHSRETRSIAAGARNIDTILRPEFDLLHPTRQGYTLVYLKRGIGESILPRLERAAEGRPLVVYGLDPLPGSKAEFRKLSPDGFLRDLAGADAVVAHAGNQLISEALFLRKPMLAIPVPSQHEQHVNGFYLERTGGGVALLPAEATEERLGEFLAHVAPTLSSARLAPRENGVHTAVRIIDECLGAA